MNDDAPLAIAGDVTDLVMRARAFTIQTQDDYQSVAGFLLGIKALRARIADTFDDHIARARAAHLALVQEKREAEAAAAEAEGIAKQLIVAWDEAQRQLIAKARAIIDEQQQAERDALAQAADDAEAFGEYQQADALRTEAAQLVPPVLPPARQPVQGISVRETWTARVTDLGKLVAAAAQHPPYLALLKADMPRLHAQARSLRARLQIPGVEAVCSKNVAASLRADHGEQ